MVIIIINRYINNNKRWKGGEMDSGFWTYVLEYELYKLP